MSSNSTLRSRNIVRLGCVMIAALTGSVACSGNDDSTRPGALDAATNDGASVDAYEDASGAGDVDSAMDADLDVVDVDTGDADSGPDAGNVDAGDAGNVDAAIGPAQPRAGLLR